MMPTQSPFAMAYGMNNAAMAKPQKQVNPLEIALKQAGKTLGDSISNDMLQAKQMGVPQDHLIKELMRIASLGSQNIVKDEQYYGASNDGGGQPWMQPGGGPPNLPPMMPSGNKRPEEQPQYVSSTLDVQRQAPQQPQGVTGQAVMPQVGVQPQQPMMNPWSPMQVLPASSPFGSAKMEGGNVRSSGALGAIFGRSTEDILRQQTALAGINESMQKMAGEQPLQKGRREELGIEAKNEFEKQRITYANELAKRGMLTAKDLSDLATNDSIIKDYNMTTQSMAEINRLMEDKTGASDIAIVFKFMKALDPASTVREGEQAQARDVSGMAAKYLNMYNSVIKGRKLDDEARKQILSASKKVFEGRRTSFDSRVKELTALGKQSGVDARMFIPQTALKEESSQKTNKVGKYSFA